VVISKVEEGLELSSPVRKEPTSDSLQLWFGSGKSARISGVSEWCVHVASKAQLLNCNRALAVALPQTPLIAPALRGRLRGLAANQFRYHSDK